MTTTESPITTTESAMTTTETPIAARSARQSFARRALAVLAAVVASVGIFSTVPAQAATGTTYVTVCSPSLGASIRPATVSSYWDNGSTWTPQQSGANCSRFTLVHNGYWYFYSSTYAIVGCTEYVWYRYSAVYIKQNLPASTSISLPLTSVYSINFC